MLLHVHVCWQHSSVQLCNQRHSTAYHVQLPIATMVHAPLVPSMHTTCMNSGAALQLQLDSCAHIVCYTENVRCLTCCERLL